MKIRLSFIPVLFILLLAGCASGKGNGFLYRYSGLQVVTDPAGATVMVLGKEIGITPLEIPQIRLYPPGYDSSYQDDYGFVIVKKPGCKSVKHRVVPKDFRTGLQITLECSTITAWNISPGRIRERKRSDRI